MTVATHESGYKSAKTLGAAEMLDAFLKTRPHADKGESLFSGSGGPPGSLSEFANGLAPAGPADRESLRSLRDA